LAFGGAPLGPDAPGAGTCEGVTVVGGVPIQWCRARDFGRRGKRLPAPLGDGAAV
jgi:hypothetical protein